MEATVQMDCVLMDVEYVECTHPGEHEPAGRLELWVTIEKNTRRIIGCEVMCPGDTVVHTLGATAE